MSDKEKSEYKPFVDFEDLPKITLNFTDGTKEEISRRSLKRGKWRESKRVTDFQHKWQEASKKKK